MPKSLSLSIGLRYIGTYRQGGFISFISFSSMIGIALGVIVLIVVLSVMNGFEQAMRDRILSVVSHVVVSETDALVENWRGRRQDLLKIKHVVSASPFIEKYVMLNDGETIQGVTLEGVLPDYEKAEGNVSSKMLEGSFEDLEDGGDNIIIGVKVAELLKLKVGNSVTLLTFDKGEMTSGEPPRFKEFNIVGIFRVDMQDYDQGVAFVHMKDAARLFDMGQSVSGIRLRLDDLYKAPVVSELIANSSGNDYWIRNWTLEKENFFKAIQIQKTMMFFLLGLIILVAAFNLISTLVMVVVEKGSSIAILRTLGMTPLGVMKVFMVQGTVIGISGTLLGTTAGILLAKNVDVIVPWLEQLFSVNFISEDIYGISTLESRILWLDVLIVTVSALILSVSATLFPSWKASRVQPAEALRNE